jgi:hypothetical protein
MLVDRVIPVGRSGELPDDSIVYQFSREQNKQQQLEPTSQQMIISEMQINLGTTS